MLAWHTAAHQQPRTGGVTIESRRGAPGWALISEDAAQLIVIVPTVKATWFRFAEADF